MIHLGSLLGITSFSGLVGKRASAVPEKDKEKADSPSTKEDDVPKPIAAIVPEPAPEPEVPEVRWRCKFELSGGRE